MSKTKRDLLVEVARDCFLTAYFEAALWSSTDGNDVSLDENYEVDDFTFKALKECVQDCRDFLNMPGVMESIDGLYARAGHDFWLTRNRHGAGFWDGDWEGRAEKILDNASRSYGEVFIYPYRGKLYIG